ncbi:hypothetical protein CHS0354_014724 [Potamilus streckersoni]|uniref:Reverse transcriptase domain-containing protein n=1 Tax=Potamilus streckersoni TaxID=2493646 RepID=A0AAE0VZH7_9BIVA|nr:hypothetical protein CHS0354_014724 [Potamilus streckersoni]
MYYDSKIKPSQFKVGDQVLLHNTRTLTRKGGKLNPLWSKPYTIQEVLKSDCYRLNGQSVAVNRCRLKEYKFKHETNQDTDQRSSNMAYTGEKKMKGNNSTKYGRNEYMSRKHKDVKDSEQNIVSNERSTVTDLPILPNGQSSPKKDEDQNYGYCSEKVNARRSACKREKEPDVTIKSHQEDSKLKWKMGGQNNSEDETFLPPKKGKNLEVLWMHMRLMVKPPYLPVRKYLPEKYWKYVSAQTLEAALVNNYNDEKIPQEIKEYPDTVYAQKYKDANYNIPGTENAVKEFDPNVFNLLSDHENFVDLMF